MDKHMWNKAAAMLEPNSEQKQRMLQGSLESYKNQPEQSVRVGRKGRRPAPVVTTLVCCLLATTALAAVYLGLAAKWSF